MTLEEFKSLENGTAVVLHGMIDGKKFDKVWVVVSDKDMYFGDLDEPSTNEVAFLMTWRETDGEDDCDWWVTEEFHECVLFEIPKTGLSKFLEATS